MGQLHLLSQGDVKEPESCLSEALLTADLCVFSHLSCRVVCVCVCVRVCVCVGGEGCVFACQFRCIRMCACKWGTLKDPSLSLCCLNEQSVLLISSQAYPTLAPALPLVTGKLWQFKTVDIVLAVRSAYAENISVCFLPYAAGRAAASLMDANSGLEERVRREDRATATHRTMKETITYLFISNVSKLTLTVHGVQDQDSNLVSVLNAKEVIS